MTAITGAVPRPFLKVPAFRAGALQSDVTRRTFHEGCESLGTSDAASERFPEGEIEKAEASLPSIELVGSRLALVKTEARVRLRPVRLG